MKVDRVIFAVNSNPLYADFWNVFSPVWKQRFNITPTLIFVGTDEEMAKCRLSSTYGEIIRVDPVPSVILNPGKDWSVTWAFMWAPVLFPNDICMTSGIDQLPLSDLFFKMLEPIPDNKYVVGFNGAYRDQPLLYPSSHHVARGLTFVKIYELVSRWDVEVQRIFDKRLDHLHLDNVCYWGLDEAHSSKVLNEYTNQNEIVRMDMFFDEWVPRRIDRGGHGMRYDVGQLEKGWYSELHAPRPYNQYKDWIDKVIKHVMAGTK